MQSDPKSLIAALQMFSKGGTFSRFDVFKPCADMDDPEGVVKLIPKKRSIIGAILKNSDGSEFTAAAQISFPTSHEASRFFLEHDKSALTLECGYYILNCVTIARSDKRVHVSFLITIDADIKNVETLRYDIFLSMERLLERLANPTGGVVHIETAWQLLRPCPFGVSCADDEADDVDDGVLPTKTARLLFQGHKERADIGNFIRSLLKSDAYACDEAMSRAVRKSRSKRPSNYTKLLRGDVSRRGNDS